MATELWVDGKLCDLEKKEVIAMSYGVNRLTDIQSRQGYYSNTFKLPKTANNLEIFGIPTELNSTDTKRWERLECYILTDGIYQVLGFAQLQSVQDDLSVVVKGGNSQFVDDIRDLKLEDLNLSTLDHIRNLTNIDAARFNDYTDGYVYPDVDYNFLKNLNNPLPYWFMYPAVFVDSILRAIVTDAGYTIAGEVLDNATFKKMVVPFSRPFLRTSSDYVTNNQFKAKMQVGNLAVSTVSPYIGNYAAGFNNDSTDGYFDNPNAFTLGGWGGGAFGTPNAFYIPPVAAIQTINFTTTFTVTNWDVARSNFQIRIYGLTSDSAGTGNTQPSSIYIHQDEADANGTFTIQLSATETGIPSPNIHIKFELLDTTSGFGAFNVDALSGVMWNEVSDRYDDVSDLDMAANLPDMKQPDFVKYLVNAFSLLIVTDTFTNEVSFKFFDDIPTNTGEDWSDKIDKSDSPKFTPNYGSYLRNNLFQYSNNKSDDALKTLPDYGEHIIINPNVEKGKKVVYKAPFSASRPLPALPDRMFIGLSDAKDIAEFALSSYVTTSNIATVTVTTTDGFSSGDSVFFKALDSSVTLDTVNIEGLKGVTIKEVVSSTTFTINGLSAGNATAGIVGYMKDADKTKDPKPRIAIHNEVVLDNNTALIQLINGTAVTKASRLTFIDLEFENLISNYSAVLSSIIISPQMVGMLMRLSTSDINQIDFTKPKWIALFDCYFYLSYINQYKVNEVDSTGVELIRLP